MRLRVGAGTDRGRVRDLNEDAYALRAGDGLFVVCDGMGGAPAGEVASRMAVDAIVGQLGASSYPGTGTAGDERPYLPHTSLLGEAVRNSNAVIYDDARRDPRRAGMGTTVVGAWIRQHVMGVAHVGDSRAYLWHDDRLEALTRDHSLAEVRLTSGFVGAVAASEQNILVRVLGRAPDVDVDLKEVPVRPGDYVLLCSDGLTRMVPERVVAEAILRLQDPQAICDYLIAAANDNGGADNITVVVVEVAGSWWQLLRKRVARSARGQDAEAHAAV